MNTDYPFDQAATDLWNEYLADLGCPLSLPHTEEPADPDIDIDLYVV